MRNFIETSENTQEIAPSVQEAEATLSDLRRQLREAEDIQTELNVFFTKHAHRASIGDSGAKSNVERIERDLYSGEMKLRRLNTAIAEQEKILVEAQKTEATRLAHERANKARDIASSLPDLGQAMDDALADFLAKFREYRAAALQMDILDYPAFSNLDPLLEGHLALELQNVGFTQLDSYHTPQCRQPFSAFMRDQEAWTVRKTGPALGEAPPVKVEPAPVAELPPIQAPPVQIPIEKLAASINRDWAEIQAAFDANEVERAMSL